MRKEPAKAGPRRSAPLEPLRSHPCVALFIPGKSEWAEAVQWFQQSQKEWPGRRQATISTFDHPVRILDESIRGGVNSDVA